MCKEDPTDTATDGPEQPRKLARADPKYQFTLDFRGATSSISLAIIQMFSSTILPNISNNTTTSAEQKMMGSNMTTDMTSEIGMSDRR